MVSSIWNAASDGHIDDLNVLLADVSPADIEIKDQNGVTPLLQAVRNGHTQVVKALLDKGADPASVLSQGPVQQFIENPEITELFNAAQSKMASGNVSSESGYPTNIGSYPPPPPGAYPYYPTINGPPPHVPEGAVFYPPQPSADGQHVPNFGPGNLPPPDIARLIPCRYFPACRYGSSCMFAHPQTPYFQGPMPPPAQYSAPYDPMNQSYNPNYYNMPPPSFHSPPNGPVPMSSPPVGPPTMSAGPSPNEMPPLPPAPFSPNGAPPPVPYPAVSPMMSPSAYPQSGPPGSVPMPPHPLPPLYHQPPPPQPPSQSPYNTNPPPAPYAVQPNGLYPSGPVPVPVPVSYPDVNNSVKSPPLNPQPDNYGPPVNPVRDSVGHNRRGSIRRGSLGTRKPPCMFFPAGKCKNGDDCRFPHVLSDNSGPHHQPFSGGRGGAPRTRPHVNNVNGNGIGTIEEKMSTMSVRDSRSEQGPRVDAGPRPRYPPGYKNGATNGQTNKRPPVIKAQRVPNADDFPVLPGTTTPPAKAGLNGYFASANGNGTSGPTAAQILQAPAPRKENSVNGAQTRTGSPDSTTDQKQDVVINGNGHGNGIVEQPRIPQPTSVPQKQIPITFASIAAGTPPEPAAEVSVTA